MEVTFIADSILIETRKWIRVREHGFNSGPEVEMFQKAVDGKNNKEAWCMAFVQFVAKQVCTLLKLKNPLPQLYGEHCMSVWRQIPDKYKKEKPMKGGIPIWRKKMTDNGHTGIVEDPGTIYFCTIEGNTNEAGSREGDGVYPKKRLMIGGSMQLMGFIDLPQMILDQVPIMEQTVKAILPERLP